MVDMAIILLGVLVAVGEDFLSDFSLVEVIFELLFYP